jgi:single-stranded DNA-binding protein
VGGVNRVVLVGTISKYGVEVRYAASGTPCATFSLAVIEVGQERREYLTLVPCEVWGKRAEAVGELEAGQLVRFEGNLKRTKKGENEWTLVVSGFEVTPVLAPTPARSGSSNEAASAPVMVSRARRARGAPAARRQGLRGAPTARRV